MWAEAGGSGNTIFEIDAGKGVDGVGLLPPP
jgi:hypothetical protein